MRTIPAGLLLIALRGADGEIVRFNPSDSGAMPPHWFGVTTHSGGAPGLGLVKGSSAPSPFWVLSQLATDSTGSRFPLAISDAAELRDGEVAVAFRPVAETVDQAAGIIWRYREPGGDRPTKALLDSFGDTGNVSITRAQTNCPLGIRTRVYSALCNRNT